MEEIKSIIPTTSSNKNDVASDINKFCFTHSIEEERLVAESCARAREKMKKIMRVKKSDDN